MICLNFLPQEITPEGFALDIVHIILQIVETVICQRTALNHNHKWRMPTILKIIIVEVFRLRRKVQSSFQLPDLYVGYTTDFNRATAQTAQEVTEEQVFQPERKSLAWAINNRLAFLNSIAFLDSYKSIN